MTNKELIDNAKRLMEEIVLITGGEMPEHEQSVYNCLRLLRERVSYTDSDKPELKAPEIKSTKRRIKIKISF